ncbi:MAG: hypothetical protein K2L84_10225 [Muribaculaceae bacterium]|nr:hypothetical protein [Muribaculaceae bacterium]
MMKITLTELSVDKSFEVLGHCFKNLQEVRDAVSIVCRSLTDWNGKRYIRHQQPLKPIPGLCVALIYEPYPCFDASDYAYENRKYWNFFFSNSPITDEMMNRLAEMPCQSDFQYVYQDMEEFALPALYWRGDSADNMLLATN